jgi:hypothetical protein
MPLDDFFLKIGDALSRAALANHWVISRRDYDPSIVDFQLNAADNESYFVTLICDQYPLLAPSVKFRNTEGEVNDAKAWPKGSPVFHEVVKPPPSSFLCMPLTREGLQHHGDWINNVTVNSWSSDKHTLLDIFNYLHRLLNSKDYISRGP